MPAKVLVLFFHPRFEDSKANKALVHALKSLENVSVRDMYELYPDFNIHIKNEQKALEAHDIIVWLHPFYWYNCPPLMKQWLDLVLEYGWAYGKNGDHLKGKHVLQVVTVGGSREVYAPDGRNRFTVRELLQPFDQTAFLCGMHYLPPFALFAANRKSQDQLSDEALLLKQWIHLLSENPIPTKHFPDKAYLQDINPEAFYGS